MCPMAVRSDSNIEGMRGISEQLRSRLIAELDQSGPTVEMSPAAKDLRKLILHVDPIEQRPLGIWPYGHQQVQLRVRIGALRLRQIEQGQFRDFPTLAECRQIGFDVPVPIECEITHDASPLHVRSIRHPLRT